VEKRGKNLLGFLAKGRLVINQEGKTSAQNRERGGGKGLPNPLHQVEKKDGKRKKGNTCISAVWQ